MHRSSLEFLILTLSSGCVSLDSLILTLCIWFEKRTGGAGRSGICCDNLQAQNMMLNVGPPQLRGFERSQHGSSWPCPSERANERREPGRVEFAWLWRRAKRESSRVSSTLHVPSPLDGLPYVSVHTAPATSPCFRIKAQPSRRSRCPCHCFLFILFPILLTTRGAWHKVV